MTIAFPLKWPEGWQRTDAAWRRPGQFAVTFDKCKTELYDELSRLDASAVVISSNLQLRIDGTPRGDMARVKIPDPGVALYFMLRGRQTTMARDAFDTPLANMRSIGLAVAHLRGLERHGGGQMMERAFEGFMALPPPQTDSRRSWRAVFKLEDVPLPEDVALAVVEARYRKLAAATGGDGPSMVELNLAIEDARRELR
jgi:hypothetical protein